MTEKDAMTPELLEQWAEETLEEWLDGYYTPHLEDNRQRRVERVEENIYTVADFDGDNPLRKFRVGISVEEVRD